MLTETQQLGNQKTFRHYVRLALIDAIMAEEGFELRMTRQFCLLIFVTYLILRLKIIVSAKWNHIFFL